MAGRNLPFPGTKPCGAFSLIELLVATAVLCLLCAIIFSIIDVSTKGWRTQEGQEDSFREVRAALNIFSRDSQNVIATTNAAWFSVETNRFAFITSLPASAQRDTDLSDICTVGYSLEWGKIDTNNPQEKECYALYRYVQFSNPTFSDTLGPTNSVSTIFSVVDGTSTVRELVARNILTLRCAPFSTNSVGGLIPFQPSAQNGVPDILDLSLSAVGENTARRLTTQADWADTNSLLLRQSMQTFNLRIHLPRPILSTP